MRHQQIVFETNSKAAKEDTTKALADLEDSHAGLFPFCDKKPFYDKHQLYEGGVAVSAAAAALLMKSGKIPSRLHGTGKGYLVVDYFSLVEYLYPHHQDRLLPTKLTPDSKDIDLIESMKESPYVSN